MSEQEQKQEQEQRLIEQTTVERELSLLLLLHVFFSFLLAALLVYGLLLPGPFTTILEIHLKKIGQLPPELVPQILIGLAVFSGFNIFSSVCLKKRKFKVVSMVAAFLNCFTVVGIPLGLTTIITLMKAEVKTQFN